MAGATLSVGLRFVHFDLIKTQSSKCYSYPHFIDEQMQAQIDFNGWKFKQLRFSRGRNQTPGTWGRTCVPGSSIPSAFWVTVQTLAVVVFRRHMDSSSQARQVIFMDKEVTEPGQTAPGGSRPEAQLHTQQKGR